MNYTEPEISCFVGKVTRSGILDYLCKMVGDSYVALGNEPIRLDFIKKLIMREFVRLERIRLGLKYEPKSEYDFEVVVCPPLAIVIELVYKILVSSDVINCWNEIELGGGE